MHARFFVKTAVVIIGLLGPVTVMAADKACEPFLPREAAARQLSISEGISRVLKDSRLLKIALPDKDMAFEDTLIARPAMFPHLSASAAKTFYRYQPAFKFGGATVYNAEKEPFSFGVELYQTLFDFGKSLANYRAAREVMNAREADIESIKRLAVLEFVTAYFDLLQAEKMIAVAEKEVESISSYMEDVQHLYEQGAAVQNDLLPVQVRLADAKTRLIVARNGREIAAASLDNLLALPLNEEVEVADIEMSPPDLPPIEDAWKLAAEQRYELAFLEKMAKASSFSEKAKARENWPTLFAQGDYTREQNKYLGHEENAVIRLGAKVNLYEGGAEQAEVMKTRARQVQLKEQRNKLGEDIKLEVKNGYAGLRNAGERVAVAKGALAQADENVRVNRVKYAEGVSTPTDVLAAIAARTGAQTNYYAADYELKRAYSRLMYSMGIDLALVYERIERGYHERTK